MSKDKLSLSKIINFISTQSNNIPKKDDGTLSKIFKWMKISKDVYDEFYFGNRKSKHYYINKYDLLKQNNSTFVDVFFKTSVKSLFLIEEIQLSDWYGVTIAQSKFGMLLFISYSYSDKPYASEFYSSQGFQFTEVLDIISKEFNHKIDINLSFEDNCVKNIDISEIPTESEVLSDKRLSDLNNFIEQSRKYDEDKIPMTYMFVGEPGTGKSTFATVFALKTNKKILRLDANAFSSMQNINAIISGLKPEVLVIDDVDRASNLQKCLSSIMMFLTDIKITCPNLTIILTVNNINVFDSAFIRPGRIDEIVEFTLPNDNERKSIITEYLKKYTIPIVDDELTKLVEETKELSAAYIKNIIIKRKYKPTDDVILYIKKMKEFKNKSSKT